MGGIATWPTRFWQNAIDTDAPVASLLRWPRWLVACALGRPAVARFATGDLRMRLVPRIAAFGTTSIFIKRDHYEPELLLVRRFVEPGDIVLDIGASYGIFSLFLAEYAGTSGRVYAFEPGVFSSEQLAANVALNGFGDRITVFRLAAASAPGRLRLHHLGGSPVNFSLGEVQGATSEEVEVARIDACVPDADRTRVAFIKIDVEGFERDALEGARAILEASRPTIMFEVSIAALARAGMTPADIYAFLQTFGYTFHRFDGEGQLEPLDGTPEGNIIACHPQGPTLRAG